MRLRVTSQMLNNNRRRAGMSSRSSSLLNYVNGSKSGGSSRLSALNTGSARANRLMASSYEKLEKSSVKLTDQAKLLSEKVDAKDDKITEQVTKLIDNYNATLSDLKQSSGVLNQYYHQTLRDVALENQDALEEIGITVSSGGTLSLNSEKLKNADWEKVEKLLGSEGDFLKRMNYVAVRVADNARTNAESLSSTYNSSGNLSSSYLSRINYRR